MTENNSNAISASLVNRKVYTVCYTGLDTLASFHDSLYKARRSYFDSGKAVHIRERGVFDGLSGEVRGKLSRRTLKWKKRVDQKVTESAFANGGQRGIAFYNSYGALRARVYYDGDMLWQRTEYFSPDDSHRARTTFKPDDRRDAVIRFDYNESTGKTKETVLFPVPYAYQTAEQSLQNAQFGDRFLLVSDERGEYAYCPREEQQRRIRFLKQNKNASVLLSMAWEVKDGDLPETPAAETEDAPQFTDLQEPALLDFLSDPTEKPHEAEIVSEPLEDKAPEPETAPAAAEEITPEAETVPETEKEPAPATEVSPETAEEPTSEAKVIAEPTEKTEPETEIVPKSEEEPASEAENAPETEETVPESEIIPETTEEPAPEPESAPEATEEPAPATEEENTQENGITLIRNGVPQRYSGMLTKDGRRDGFGRTETADGITVFEGEYKNDLRDGFGVHHYRSGAVSYIGDFKEDKRSGFGVSFREKDHALHVSHWEDGKPVGMAALFGNDGTLRYAGQIIDGKKEGAGVSVNPETGCVFVEKFENNERTGQGTLFAPDGSLLYAGGWQNGMRHGHGTEFDKDGNVVYTGEWKNDRYENGILYRHVQNEDKS